MIFLLLEHLRSLHNVSAIFRSAEACQVDWIYLLGPTGIINPQVLNPKLSKTSLGTEKTVAWKHFWDLDQALASLPKNTTIIALEQIKNAQNIFSYQFSAPSYALIVGNEITGVSQKARQIAASIVHIPMKGKHPSLNVACATTVALYQLNRHWHIC
jgi:tRNA G18 (ribose-2'-O)-methylase SpoU